MTAVHDTIQTLGSTRARLFTPPLPEHCGPTGELAEEHTWGYDCIWFLENICGWTLLPWQRWLYISALEKGKDGKGFRFKIVIVLVARQNGKSRWLRGLGLWRLFMDKYGRADPYWPAARLAVIACQNLDYSEGQLKEVVDEVRDNPLLRPELLNHRECLAVDTPILTTNGWKTMGTLTVGDQVYHPDGHPTDVLEVHPQHVGRDCYRVETTDGRSVIADANHLWMVASSRGTPDWQKLSTDELLASGIESSQGVPVWRLPDQQAIVSKPADLPIDPYLLGVWLGDGVSVDNELTLGPDDADELLSHVDIDVKRRYLYERAERIRFDLPGGWQRNEFKRRTAELGIWGNKHIPDNYLAASEEQRRALLAGLLDTDGSISKQGQVEFCTMRQDLADQVLYLCRSLGHKASLRTGTARIGEVDYGTKYRVFFTPNGNPFRLARHSARYKEPGRRGPSRTALMIKSITPVKSTPVNCISVNSQDGLFLAGPALLPTSNTNGKHKMILTNRRSWRAATASRKGARSLSVDIAMLDELREHTTFDAWNAITPTTTARPHSQIIACSNAGDERSEVLRQQRDTCVRRIKSGETERTQTGFFEWSVPNDVDPHDPAYWYLANPAMGHLNDFTIDDLRGFLEAMEFRNMPGFQTEHLALDVATPVLTTEGWKSMGDVVPGDQVFHPDGHPVDVVRTTALFDDRECYRVETVDGRSVVADADHRWTVNDRRGGRGWETLTTRQLVERGVARNRSGGRYAYRLPDQRTVISKPVDLPLDPYVLGAWLGDGTSTKPEITCATDDVEDMRAALGVATSVTPCQGRGAYRIRLNLAAPWSRSGFAYRAQEVGVWKNKHVPRAYLEAGTEQRLALLQGLMDTDGSVGNANLVRFCNTNKQIAESVLYLARSLGQRATMRPSHGGSAWMVAFTASRIQPFRLPRKAQRVTDSPTRAGERTAISIRSITPVGRRQTRCITVDSPDSLFLAGPHLLPTANCQWVAAMDPGIIPAEHWAATTDPTSRRAEGTEVVAAVDVNYDRTRAYVVIAARRADNKIHTEIVAAARGTDWLIDWFTERKGKFKYIAMQKTGAPVSSMIDEFEDAGIEITPVNTGVDLQSAFAAFYDGICEHRVMHRPATLFDRAAASALSRNSGEALVFDRRNSPVDAAPLVAASLAVWLEDNPPLLKAPTVHAWPDEDEIQKWEEEARQTWGEEGW